MKKKKKTFSYTDSVDYITNTRTFRVILLLTYNSEGHRVAVTSLHEIFCHTRVVRGISEADLFKDEAAFSCYPDVVGLVQAVSILQPIHLHKSYCRLFAYRSRRCHRHLTIPSHHHHITIISRQSCLSSSSSSSVVIIFNSLSTLFIIIMKAIK